MSCSSWREVWDYTTIANPDPSYLAPTRDTLTITNPRPNSEYTQTNRAEYTHSEVPYEMVCCVYGGRPPFNFAVTGMPDISLEIKSPSRNPGMTTWAVIRLPAGVEGIYTLTVTDQDGAVDVVSVSVTNDNSKFIFIDTSTGLDPADRNGTFNSPFKNYDDMLFGVYEDDTYIDKILVHLDVGPHYLVSNYTRATVDWFNITNKPKCWIGYPGIKPQIKGTNARGGFIMDGGGSFHDSCFINFDISDMEQGIRIVPGSARCCFWDLIFHDIRNRVLTEEGSSLAQISNLACISLLGNGLQGNNYTAHIHKSVCDIGIYDCEKIKDGVNLAGVLTYENWYGSYDYIYHIPTSQGGGKFTYGTLVYIKNSAKASVTSCFAWFEDYNPGRGSMFCTFSYKAKAVDGYAATDDDIISQLRYCLFGSTNNTRQSVSWCYIRSGDETEFQVGKRYMDRCSTVGSSVYSPGKEDDFRNQAAGYGPYAKGCISVAVNNWYNPPYFNQYIHYDTDCALLVDGDADVANYIAEDGSTVGLNKYKIGWEVQ